MTPTLAALEATLRAVPQEVLWPAFAAASLIAILGIARLSPTPRERRHGRYRARADRAIATLRAIGPMHQPERAFGYLRRVNPYVFEEMVLTLLERRKITVRRNRTYSGDGGIDAAFELDGQRWLIQAKRYSQTINPSHVADFEAVCRRNDALGMFIHTGRTGATARAFEQGAAHVRIVSGDDLLALVAGERFNLFGRGAPSGVAPVRPPAPRLIVNAPDLVVTGRTNSPLRRRPPGR